MSQVTSFPPIAEPDARILILGSMPGAASLAARQYYAHPRNAFWPIIVSLLELPADADYAERCQALTGAGYALWDVMRQCVRPGSLDANISADSIVPNDFEEFFRQHRRIERIFCNGGKSYETYCKRVVPNLSKKYASIPTTRLPSTSPAHAALTIEAKCDAWRVIRD